MLNAIWGMVIGLGVLTSVFAKPSRLKDAVLFTLALAVILLFAFGCNASPYGSLRRTSQVGATVADRSLNTYPCTDTAANEAAEVGLALEAVLYAFDTTGMLPYTNTNLERLSLYDTRGSINVCFVDRIVQAAGLSNAYNVWISLSDKDGARLPSLKHTALVHELVHVVLARSCVLERCDTDGDHTDSRLWCSSGNSESVECIARQMWRGGL